MLIALLCLPLRADDASFARLCGQFGLDFQIPRGYVSAPPPEHCDYAMRSGDNTIIYFVQAASPRYAQLFRELAAETSGVPVDKIEVNEFKPDDVKAEFGADAGSLTFFPSPEGDGICLLCCFHKESRADVFVFYMAPDKERLLKMIEDQTVFRALTFK